MPIRIPDSLPAHAILEAEIYLLWLNTVRCIRIYVRLMFWFWIWCQQKLLLKHSFCVSSPTHHSDMCWLFTDSKLHFHTHRSWTFKTVLLHLWPDQGSPLWRHDYHWCTAWLCAIWRNCLLGWGLQNHGMDKDTRSLYIPSVLGSLCRTLLSLRH